MNSKTRIAGFSMVEVLVALAIMAILGAVMIPALNGKLQDSRETAISQSLNGIALGMAEYKKAMGRYPGQLNLLADNPVVASTDICGNTTSLSSTALWRGPYISREFSTAGMPIGDGRILSPVRRSPTTVTSTPPTIAYALVDVTGVETSVATDLEKLFDGVSDNTAGTIRYTTSTIPAQSGAGVNQTPLISAAAAGTVNLTFAIPINSTGC
jgi:prepilin-type N-terminal cleavage/methylation domain-containing protein